jgi:hypothetical protein
VLQLLVHIKLIVDEYVMAMNYSLINNFHLIVIGQHWKNIHYKQTTTNKQDEHRNKT